MIKFNQEQKINNIWDKAENLSNREINIRVRDNNREGEVDNICYTPILTGRYIIVAFIKIVNNVNDKKDKFGKITSTTVTVSSDSIFIPFIKKK